MVALHTTGRRQRGAGRGAARTAFLFFFPQASNARTCVDNSNMQYVSTVRSVTMLDQGGFDTGGEMPGRILGIGVIC
ncbi:hypothetical protein B0H67DRAFT_562601 [Lasiosphaeris hirsuta]|uniref:Uncharacterized protein n=1 Tax=Lasiosphaeris hirsuta TaxID=260670 RepID=A0AA40E736_9PEZI|nr:hypothetical protein B0H67DRAFT_562601 [Lasiosphaeris hirsuta]